MTLCEDSECGEEITNARADARYCSAACRQQAYRRRKRFTERYGSDPDVVIARLQSELDALRLRVSDSRNAESR